MRIIDLDSLATTPILEYESTAAAAASVAQGHGDGHVHWLHFGPGAVIGPHPAGPAQLVIPVKGNGAAGADAVRQPIAPGSWLIAPGEVHSNGSENGMSALMVQLSTLTLAA